MRKPNLISRCLSLAVKLFWRFGCWAVEHRHVYYRTETINISWCRRCGKVASVISKSKKDDSWSP